jgi:hypothetical protein
MPGNKSSSLGVIQLTSSERERKAGGLEARARSVGPQSRLDYSGNLACGENAKTARASSLRAPSVRLMTLVSTSSVTSLVVAPSFPPPRPTPRPAANYAGRAFFKETTGVERNSRLPLH